MTTYVSGNVDWGSTSTGGPGTAYVISRFTAMHDALIGAGLIQTADTGQLNIAGIASQGNANFDHGYRIYRFNDSLQATDPLFIKVIFGTGDNVGHTCLRVTTGQGSNGSGTLTGRVSTQLRCGGAYIGPTQNMSNSTFYACHTEGFFGLNFCPNNSHPANYSTLALTIARTRDTSGNFDGVGNVLSSWQSSGNATGHTAFTRTLDNQFSGSASTHVCIAPGVPANTALLNGDKQLYPHWYNLPDVRQRWSSFTIRSSELGNSPTSFSASPFNGVSRTFLSIGTATGSGGLAVANATDDGNFVPCFLWE